MQGPHRKRGSPARMPRPCPGRAHGRGGGSPSPDRIYPRGPSGRFDDEREGLDVRRVFRVCTDQVQNFVRVLRHGGQVMVGGRSLLLIELLDVPLMRFLLRLDDRIEPSLVRRCAWPIASGAVAKPSIMANTPRDCRIMTRTSFPLRQQKPLMPWPEEAPAGRPDAYGRSVSGPSTVATECEDHTRTLTALAPCHSLFEKLESRL